MTLQISVSLISIEKQLDPPGLLVTMQLKCWNEGDDIKTDLPVIDESVSSIAGETTPAMLPNQQVERVVLDITKKMQYIINIYKIENNLLAGELLEAAISDIQNSLTG